MPIRRVVIDPDLLTPKDFKRARVALGGRDPFELLQGDRQEDRAVLIAWCQLSRDDPDLSLEQLEETPFGEFIETEAAEGEPDPQTGSPASNGSRPVNDSAPKSRAKRVSSEPASDAATSSA